MRFSYTLNITNNRWRKEVKDEIEELIDYKIIHPSIDKTKPHISFLVTNGDIEDTVRLGIDNLNNGKWKNTPLKVVTGGELLKRFFEVSEDFLPQKIEDYQLFLELYLSDKSELLDEKKFCNFIHKVLKLETEGLPNEERKRNIAAAVLYSSYFLASAKKIGNFITCMQILTLLITSIFALVEKYKLEGKYWKGSFEIAWSELYAIGQSLQDEIKTDGLKTLVNSLWDGELGVFRRHLAVSYLFSFKLGQMLNNDADWKDICNEEFTNLLQNTVAIWSEQAIISLIFVFTLLNKYNPNGGIPFLEEGLDAIIQKNGRKGTQGLLSPYYDIRTALENKLGLLDIPIDENFHLRSFFIKALINLAARHDSRAMLEKRWREISYISQHEFTPEANWMHFLWRCEPGENSMDYPHQTQSWAALVADAMKIDINAIPKVLQESNKFLPYFLMIFPHRATSNYIKYLDKLVFDKPHTL